MSGSASKFITASEASTWFHYGRQRRRPALIVADGWKVVCDALGRLRLDVVAQAGIIDDKAMEFLWSLSSRFWIGIRRKTLRRCPPSFHCRDERRFQLLDSNQVEFAPRRTTRPNGVELGGGSIISIEPMSRRRCSRPWASPTMTKAPFRTSLKLCPWRTTAWYGNRTDRFVMLMCGAKSIRDVIAFPKTAKAPCLMTDSPSQVETKQLDELFIKTTV